MGFWDNLKGDTGAMRLAGIGQVLSALDQGQTPNVAPFLDAIGAQKQTDAFRQSLQSDDMMGKFSAEERSFLATLPPQLAQNLIAERLFAQSAPVNLQTFQGHDGTVYSFNPQTGQATPLTEAAPAPQGFRQITGQEAAASGLDPSKAYNVGPDGKISEIGGSGVTVNNNMGGGKFEEAWAKNDADAIGAISEAGMAAMRNQPRIDQLDALMEANPTGGIANLQVLAGEWGINTSGLDELQTAQAIVNSMVPEQRQPGSGPMSDADLALFKQSLPRIINQPGGNRLIIDTLRAIAQYDAEGAQIVQAGREGLMTRAEMFAALQARENPLGKLVAPSAERKAGSEAAWRDLGGGIRIREKN